MKGNIFIAAAFVLSGCSNMQVRPLDPATGHFPSNGDATVVLAKPVDMDARRDLIVVGNSAFLTGQLQNIHFFREVMTLDELEKRVIEAKLTDQIPSIGDKIGLSRAARFYRPFLWLHVAQRGEGYGQYLQLILTDPATLDDYFVTETHIDYVVTRGINDQTNWYPMFNSLIDYLKQNSHKTDAVMNDRSPKSTVLASRS